MTPNPMQSSPLALLQTGETYGQPEQAAQSGVSDQLKGIMSAAVNVAAALPDDPQTAEFMRQIRQLAMQAVMRLQQTGSESAPQGMAPAAY